MLSDVAATSEAALRALGFRVRSRSGETWELLLPNSRPATRVLRGDRARITLSDARKRGDRPDGTRTLLVAPSASPGVLDAALLGRWDLLLWDHPRAVINGVAYAAIGSGPPSDAPRRGAREPAPAPTASERTGGRRAWTRWGIARILLLDGPADVAALAGRLDASPQAVRRALGQWGGLVQRGTDGAWSVPDAAGLRSALGTGYEGPGGRRSGWFSPLPAARQGVLAAAALGPDARALTVPGRALVLVAPESAVQAPLRAAGFVPAPAGRASLTVLEPKDTTAWVTARVGAEGVASVDPILAELLG